MRSGEQVLRISSQIASLIGEVSHLARSFLRAPRFKAREIFGWNSGRDTSQLKTAAGSKLLNRIRADCQLESLLTSPFILTSPLIELQNVFVQRGDFLALKGLSLRIDSGEHVAILGPNGCGKSTLIKTVTRECYPLVRPETSLRILGQQNWNIFELRSYLGVVSNDLMAQCTRDITGRELVLSGFFGSIGIWPNHHVTPEMEAAARHAMERLEAQHLADRWLDELSSGEARRLLIARALVHHPSTLLLDEPTTSLDLPTLREIRGQLRSLAQNGVGLLLITHHLDDIIPEIERVVLLRDGVVHLDGPKHEMLTSGGLSEVFRVPLRVFERDGFYHAW